MLQFPELHPLNDESKWRKVTVGGEGGGEIGADRSWVWPCVFPWLHDYCIPARTEGSAGTKDCEWWTAFRYETIEAELNYLPKTVRDFGEQKAYYALLFDLNNIKCDRESVYIYRLRHLKQQPLLRCVLWLCSHKNKYLRFFACFKVSFLAVLSFNVGTFQHDCRFKSGPRPLTNHFQNIRFCIW